MCKKQCSGANRRGEKWKKKIVTRKKSDSNRGIRVNQWAIGWIKDTRGYTGG